MAAPNLKNLTNIFSKTIPYHVTNSITSTLSNSAGSGKVLKVTTIIAVNVNTSSGTITVSHYRSADDLKLCNAITVSPNADLVIIDKNRPINLEEGDAIRAVASATSIFDLIICYEDLS